MDTRSKNSTSSKKSNKRNAGRKNNGETSLKVSVVAHQNIRNSVSKSTHKTPESSTSQTPKGQRHQMKLRLRKMVTANEDGSESSSTGASEDDNSGEESEADQTKSLQPKQTVKSLSQNSKKSLETRVADYFDAQSKSPLTSSKTLASVRQDLLEMDVQQLLSEVPPKHGDEIKSLIDGHKRKFHKWMVYLRNGFNLLLYGLGSKISLLDQFRPCLMEDYTVLEVKGFLPDLDINLIMQSIMKIIKHEDSFTKMEEQLSFIKKTFDSSKYGELCLLVHNIDGNGLRNDKAQGILCSLAQCSSIHIVASIDHVRTSLLWNTDKLASFNWSWEDVTTFSPYIEETAHENSVLVKRTGSLALSSATQVFHSLTPNAKGIFILLAKYQLKNLETSSNYFGMPFQECYSLCRESFLVNSQLTLNTQLTEFKDHKLLKIKKGSDGGEYLFITLEFDALSAFLKSQS